ncbi:MAG: BON domain-containing protein [Spirochaetia bacterium]
MPIHDNDLKQDITDRLEMNGNYNISRLTVDVTDRKAVISGSVQLSQLKDEISREVGNIPGVLSVDNRLTVEEEDSGQDFPSAENEIVNQILEDPEIQVDYLSVRKNSESITLNGFVKTPWEKERAEMIALQNPGISGVENLIVVAAVENQEDYSIAQQIGESLKRKSDVHLGKITIKIDGGEVMLTGIVPTWYDKNTIYDAAVHTSGVKSVENDIQVEQY